MLTFRTTQTCFSSGGRRPPQMGKWESPWVFIVLYITSFSSPITDIIFPTLDTFPIFPSPVEFFHASLLFSLALD